MVEGAPLPASVHDSENYAVEIVEHFCCRNTHGEKT
jgi:hypothetical protein